MNSKAMSPNQGLIRTELMNSKEIESESGIHIVKSESMNQVGHKL